MDAEITEIEFSPTLDAGKVQSPEFQSELRDLVGSLKAQGIDVSPEEEFWNSADSGSFLTGVMSFANASSSLVSVVIGAWLHARYGRKIRVKVGEIEVEAQTIKDVETLLAEAKKIQQRQKSKLVHES